MRSVRTPEHLKAQALALIRDGYSSREAAAMTGVNDRTIRCWMAQQRVLTTEPRKPAVKSGVVAGKPYARGMVW